jgi:hypothetical protein
MGSIRRAPCIDRWEDALPTPLRRPAQRSAGRRRMCQECADSLNGVAGLEDLAERLEQALLLPLRTPHLRVLAPSPEDSPRRLNRTTHATSVYSAGAGREGAPRRRSLTGWGRGFFRGPVRAVSAPRFSSPPKGGDETSDHHDDKDHDDGRFDHFFLLGNK